MPEQKINRRKFLKRIGIGIGVLAAAKVGHIFWRRIKDSEIPENMKGKLFLKDWEVKPWSKEYYDHIVEGRRAGDEKLRESISTRHPNKVSKVIEEWPNIKEFEMGWVKKKGFFGEITPAAESEDRYIGINPDGTKHGGVNMEITGSHRSAVHSHRAPVTEKDRVIASNPSIEDIFLFLRPFLRLQGDYYTNPDGSIGKMNEVKPFVKVNGLLPLMRVQHVAALDKEGKVIGYFSTRIGKKIIENPANLEKCFEEISKFSKKYPGYESAEVRSKLVQLLISLKKYGFQVRMTSRPGYIYKDFHFQKKS